MVDPDTRCVLCRRVLYFSLTARSFLACGSCLRGDVRKAQACDSLPGMGSLTDIAASLNQIAADLAQIHAEHQAQAPAVPDGSVVIAQAELDALVAQAQSVEVAAQAEEHPAPVAAAPADAPTVPADGGVPAAPPAGVPDASPVPAAEQVPENPSTSAV